MQGSTDNSSEICVSIPVRHEIEGKSRCDESFTFILKAEERGSPMPEGADGDVKRVTVTGAEDPEFGIIKMSSPGAFYYTVSRAGGVHKDMTEDMEAYRVLVAGMNNGERIVLAENSSGNKVEEICYTDRYSARDIPVTGDNTGLMAVSAAALFLSGSILIALAAALYRKR